MQNHPPIASPVRTNPSSASLVELRVRGPRVIHWTAELGRRHGAELRLLACRQVGRRAPRLLRLLEISAPQPRLEGLVRELERHQGKEEVSVARMLPDRIVVRLVTPLPALCAAVFDVGAICSSCPMVSDSAEYVDGSADWDVLVPRASDAWFLIRAYARPGEPLPHLVRSRRYHSTRRLTPRQDRALALAFRLGYFEYPRRADLSAVARALGIGRTTAMEILRRATHHLLADRYGASGPNLAGLAASDETLADPATG